MTKAAHASATPLKSWLVTIALGVSALIAGNGLAPPFCYPWVNLFGSGSRDRPRELMMYSPDMGLLTIIGFLLALTWTAFWFRHSKEHWHEPLGVMHIAPPAILFAWAAWRGSQIAGPCSLF